MVANDSQGMGSIRALKDRGIKVPDEVKVLSMTGVQVGNMLETSLTSFELPGEEIGAEAASMLIRAVETQEGSKPHTQHLTLSATLFERESTM